MLTFKGRLRNEGEVHDDLIALADRVSALWNVTVYTAKWTYDNVINPATGRGQWLYRQYDLYNQLREHPAYRALADATASSELKRFEDATMAFFGKRNNGDKRARPPGFRKRRLVSGERVRTIATLDFRVGRDATIKSAHRLYNRSTYRLILRVSQGEGRPAIPLDVDLDERFNVLQYRPVRVRLKPDRDYEPRAWRVQVVAEVIGLPALRTGHKLAAIDVGINELCALVFEDGEAILYNGWPLLRAEDRYERLAARCKPANWRPGSRSRRESRRKRELNVWRARRRDHIIHNYTADIVRRCVEKGIDRIVLGDLTGIRWEEDGKAKHWQGIWQRRLHSWAFRRIADQIEYKARRHGISVSLISERGTSRTCARCGTYHKAWSESRRVGRRRGLFRCGECGLTLHADVHGGWNILCKMCDDLERPRPDLEVVLGRLARPVVTCYRWQDPSPLGLVPAGASNKEVAEIHERRRPVSQKELHTALVEDLRKAMYEQLSWL